jgi:NAD(P)-dependent dehydrogenase (short-subunit alcohol dehydrogenase family)
MHMAGAGASVVISSRKQPDCDAVVQEITDRYGPGRAIAIAANISSKQELHRLVEETIAVYGRIDVLVCNAASKSLSRPPFQDRRRAIPQGAR